MKPSNSILLERNRSSCHPLEWSRKDDIRECVLQPSFSSSSVSCRLAARHVPLCMLRPSRSLKPLRISLFDANRMAREHMDELARANISRRPINRGARKVPLITQPGLPQKIELPVLPVLELSRPQTAPESPREGSPRPQTAPSGSPISRRPEHGTVNWRGRAIASADVQTYMRSEGGRLPPAGPPPAGSRTAPLLIVRAEEETSALDVPFQNRWLLAGTRVLAQSRGDLYRKPRGRRASDSGSDSDSD